MYSVECHGFKSHPKQLFFLRKNDCLGCAVLFYLVVYLTLLALFFLPSSSLIKHVYYSCLVCVCWCADAGPSHAEHPVSAATLRPHQDCGVQ